MHAYSVIAVFSGLIITFVLQPYSLEAGQLRGLTAKQLDWWNSLGNYVGPDRTGRGKRNSEQNDIRKILRIKRQSSVCNNIELPILMRIEWRQMENSERQDFVKAVNRLARFRPDPESTRKAYNIFVLLNHENYAPGAHGGASSLPWRREYLWRFSNALRLNGRYTGALPYIDFSLDSHLPDTRHSSLWTPDHLGIINGEVQRPFVGVKTTKACELNRPNNRVFRNAFDNIVDTSGEAPITTRNINKVLSQACYTDLIGGPNSIERLLVGPFQTYFGLGSQMADLYCPPSDPVYFLHNAFIDCIWEEFRQSKQTAQQRQKDYPPLTIRSPFSWNAEMKPFSQSGRRGGGAQILNIHGLSSRYTDYYYTCGQRPSSIECTTHQDCNGSSQDKLLWCDKSNQKCVATIQEGGTCRPTWPDIQCWCPGPKTGNCETGNGNNKSSCKCN